MIITVTLNPAIDKTIYIEKFEVNQVNKIKRVREDIGGKGVNVSKNIKNLNRESLCLFTSGGVNGKYIEDSLNEMKINNKCFLVDGNSRVNLKIVDLINNTFTDINDIGDEIKKVILLKYLKR